jgi:hypothetical protein
MSELEELDRGTGPPARDGAETEGPADTGSVARKGPMDRVRGLSRVLLFFVCLALFMVAIELIKNGATGAAGLIERYLDINSPVNALGFGWFASYLVMSGSPVAAVSVAFLAAGAVEQLSAYAMIVGSRLGASFIVLFVGFMYVLRGHERRAGLTMGLLALVVTASVYLPALLVGGLLLRAEALDFVQLGQGAVLSSLLNQAMSPIVDLLSGFLPGWGVMLVGLVVLWVSFYLFDRPARTGSATEPILSGRPLGLPSPADVHPGERADTDHPIGVAVAQPAGAPLSPGLYPARERDPVHHGGQHHDHCGHAAGVGCAGQ